MVRHTQTDETASSLGSIECRVRSPVKCLRQFLRLLALPESKNAGTHRISEARDISSPSVLSGLAEPTRPAPSGPDKES